MDIDRLYGIAFAFKKTKLWKKLTDTQLFAVRHSDGTVGYCCVMGMMGEHLALSVYPGSAGMDSYREMFKDRPQNALAAHEFMFCQDCVMLSFEDMQELRPRDVEELSVYCQAHGLALKGKLAHPQFQRFRPRRYPWYVDGEADQKHIYEALEAAIEVSEKLTRSVPESVGFTEGAPYDRMVPLLEKRDGAFRWGQIALPEPNVKYHPSPELVDDIALGRLKKSRRGGEWACDVIMYVNPVVDEDEGAHGQPAAAPFFPYALVVVDNQTGIILDVPICEHPDDYALPFTRAVVDLARKYGKPARILVCNERTYALFERLAPQMGAELVTQAQIPSLDEAEQGMLDTLTEEEAQPEDHLSTIIEVLRDPRAYPELPGDILAQLLQMSDMGVLPGDIVGNLKAERKRRGMS